MKNLRVRYAFLTFFSAIILFSALFSGYRDLYSQAERYLGKTITLIRYEGNQHVSARDLNEIIQMRPGMVLTASLLNNDLKAILNHGSFSYARIEANSNNEGVELVFILQERPLVDDLRFFGLHEITEPDIRDLIYLKENRVYSEELEQKSIEAILRKYREKGLFNVAIKIRKSEVNSRKNSLKIHFLIDEGENIKIAKINILGAGKINPDQIASAMELHEDSLFQDGTFREDKFERDKETIVNYYRENGYLDAELEEARWDLRWKNPEKPDERIAVVTYKVNEGSQYFYAGYQLDWDETFLNQNTHKPVFSEDEIRKYFEYTNAGVGRIFNNSVYGRDRGIINFLYSQKGYIFARVMPEKTTVVLTEEGIAELENSARQKEYEGKKIDYYNIQRLKDIYKSEPQKRGMKFIHTRFVIAEGEKGYIENIIVKGNRKTLDKVIRRELLIAEGDLFNSELVQRSRERVYNLGFFRQVNIDARPGSGEGRMNFIMEVEEQPTGTISMGGGYGTQTGFSVFSEISENNLNGTGQKITGRFEFGPQRFALEGSWTDPWFMDTPWGLSISGFYINRQIQAPAIDGLSNTLEAPTYDKNSFGFTVGLSHRFWVNWGHYHRFSPTLSRATNASSMVNDVIYLQVKQGWQIKNTLTNGLYFDNRDNVFNTTSGLRFDLSMDMVGGPLGGTDHFNRYNPSVAFYWWPADFTFFNLIRQNLLRRWRIVFEHRLSASFTELTRPIYNRQDKNENPYVEVEDRLYLGGYESLRGWQIFDPNYPLAWRDGGSHRLLFGSELRIPVEPNLFWLVLFFDAGAVFDNPAEYIIDETTPQSTINAINSTQLTARNLSMSYFRYSWGVGFRVQIPILPLRIYLAQRLQWDEQKRWFNTVPGASNFEIVFGIGDKRF